MVVPAAPFASYSSATLAMIPSDRWDPVYASLQALKGHIQEYPGCQRVEAFVRAQDGGIRIHLYTTWDTPEELEAFLERGYTFERMLADVADLSAESTDVMEKIF